MWVFLVPLKWLELVLRGPGPVTGIKAQELAALGLSWPNERVPEVQELTFLHEIFKCSWRRPGVFFSVLKGYKLLEAETRAFQLFDGSIREAKFLFNRLFSPSKIRELAFPLHIPGKAPLTALQARTPLLMMSCNKKPPAIAPFRSGASEGWFRRSGLKCWSPLGRTRSSAGCSGSTSFTAGSSSPSAIAVWICLPMISLIEHHFGAQKRAGEVFGLPVSWAVWPSENNAQVRVALAYYFFFIFQGARLQKENPGTV